MESDQGKDTKIYLADIDAQTTLSVWEGWWRICQTSIYEAQSVDSAMACGMDEVLDIEWRGLPSLLF